MRKGDLKDIIASIAKEKKAYHYSFDGDVYLSESHFIIRTTPEIAQYIIDKVNERKRKPEWCELESLAKFYDRDKGTFTDDIEHSIIQNDGRKTLILKQKDYYTRINEKFTISGGDFYTTDWNGPVFEYVGEDILLMILPIYTDRKGDKE